MSGSAQAAPGDLDPSFSGDGVLVTDFAGASDRANAVTLQNGKIVAAGISGGNFAIARYNADGSLDTTFGGDGMVTTDFGDSDAAYAVAVSGDKIVAAGRSGNANSLLGGDWAIARYNADGSLDTSFDGDGKLTSHFGPSATITGAAIQTDGKLVVTGTVNSGDQDFVVARYNADGSLDPSFDGDGKLTTDFGWVNDVSKSLALQSDGKIVVVGSAGSRFALARYNSDGSLDPSFDSDGKQITDPKTLSPDPGTLPWDSGLNAVVLEGGKLIVAGYCNGGEEEESIAVARYNADGSLDATFSHDGFAWGTAGIGTSVVVVGEKIVAVGYSKMVTMKVTLERYNADGSADMSFGDGSVVSTDLGDRVGGWISGYALGAVVQDQKVVVAGYAEIGTEEPYAYDFALARYVMDGGTPPDTTPPETTITDGPSGTTADSTPTFAFVSSEAGSTFECSVDGAAFVACSSPHTLAVLGNGAHSFAVRARDVAGNVDPTSATRLFTVAVPDTTPPETTITAGPAGTTADNTPTFAFASSEGGSRFECSVDGRTFAACTSPYTLAALANGTHAFAVRARDAAGNLDPTPATRTFVVKVTPARDIKPPKLTLGSKYSSWRMGRDVAFKFAVNEKSTVVVTGTVRIPTSKRPRAKVRTWTLRSLVLKPTAGKSATVKLGLSKGADRAIRQAQRAHIKVSLALKITARDAAGNKATLTRTLTVRR